MVTSRQLGIITFCQAALSLLDTYLVSKISLIGKIGIATVHREYRLLRSAPTTFILFFGLQLLVIALLAVVQNRFPRKLTMAVAWALLAIAVGGGLLTYIDFLHTYSHRLLKERFHLGFYLFWIGWIATCVFFLVSSRRPEVGVQEPVAPAPLRL